MLGRGAFFVKEISQNFSGHDDDLRIRTELDVSRHDAHGGIVELLFKVLEFLIGERLDRRRIKDAHPFEQGMIDLVFANKGLS